MTTKTTGITAKHVADLRAKTGAGMMDCKKALEESGGDAAKAEELLRVKYAARAEKRADRALLGARGVLHAQQLLGLGCVAARLLERLLAVHHARAGLGAEVSHVLCGDACRLRGHCVLSLLIKTPPSRRTARGGGRCSS